MFRALPPSTLINKTRRQPLDARAMLWVLPWFTGPGVIPSCVDLIVVAVFALAVSYVGVRLALPPERVGGELVIDEVEAAAQPVTI